MPIVLLPTPRSCRQSGGSAGSDTARAVAATQRDGPCSGFHRSSARRSGETHYGTAADGTAFIGSRLLETAPDNPARVAIDSYFAAEKQNNIKAEIKRHCADPATVLYAVCGREYFGEVGPGVCEVRDDGFTRWNARTDRRQFYNIQKWPVAELEGVMEKLLIKPPGYAATSK